MTGYRHATDRGWLLGHNGCDNTINCPLTGYDRGGWLLGCECRKKDIKMNPQMTISTHNVYGYEMDIVTIVENGKQYAVYVPIKEVLKLVDNDKEGLYRFWDEVYVDYSDACQFPIVSALRTDGGGFIVDA